MSKQSDRATVLVFTAFIAFFCLINLLLPDKDFSPRENRYLQTLPSFSFRSLFQGTFTEEFEDYCSDQFAGRDRWISLKARLELLQGKQENNGVYLCADQRLMEAFSSPEQRELIRRRSLVEALADQAGIPVTLALVPSSAEIYPELLPKGAANDSQKAVIDLLCSSDHFQSADLISELSADRSEYIYYRTDHHWTSLGAYKGYLALGPALGYDPIPADPPEIVSDSFFGTAYSSSGFFWVRPDSMEILRRESPLITVHRYENAQERTVPMYDWEKLETKDKYRFFLGGNTPRLVVQTEQESLPSLLILRDSYADSLTPFLTEHFSSIHLLDLRYYRDSIAEYIQDHQIEQVLVLYSVSNFCTDTNLALMTR